MAGPKLFSNDTSRMSLIFHRHFSRRKWVKVFKQETRNLFTGKSEDSTSLHESGQPNVCVTISNLTCLSSVSGFQVSI